VTQAFDAAKLGLIVLTAAILQVTVVSSLELAGGAPDLLLVTLVAVALLRGASVGAGAGFFAGLLVDTALLGTLGLSSFLLTLVGYWAGRYGETSGRGRPHAGLVAVGAMTILLAAGELVLHFVLGVEVSPGLVLFDALLPSLLLNLALAAPVAALCARLLRRTGREPAVREVRLLG